MRYYLATDNQEILSAFIRKIKEILCISEDSPSSGILADMLYTDSQWMIEGTIIVPSKILKAMWEASKYFDKEELRFTQVGFTGFDDAKE